MRPFILAALLLSLSTAAASAATYVVHPDGTGDFPTIQAAVQAVVDDDVILLSDGTFVGDGNRDVDYLGKAITIRSQSGNAEACVIDCQGSPADPHRGFLFRHGETAGSVLDGITIQNGLASPAGGAIFLKGAAAPLIASCIISRNDWSAIYCINDAAPVFTHCRFEYNESHRGAAIDCHDATFTLLDCDFVENAALLDGGAIDLSVAGAQIAGCSFIGNTADYTAAINIGNSSQVTITDCLFAGNSATHISGAVTLFIACQGTIERCTFIDNFCSGAAGALYSDKISDTLVRDCTFWGNSGNQGTITAGHMRVTIENTIIAFNHGGPAIDSSFDYAQLACCDLYGNEGGDWVGAIADQLGQAGNICEDPLFCDPAGGDLTLRDDSPCVPAHSGGCGLIGAWPEGCGTVPAEPVTWGAIKASFR